MPRLTSGIAGIPTNASAQGFGVGGRGWGGAVHIWGMSVKNMRCPEPFISARGAARRDDARASACCGHLQDIPNAIEQAGLASPSF